MNRREWCNLLDPRLSYEVLDQFGRHWPVGRFSRTWRTTPSTHKRIFRETFEEALARHAGIRL